MEKTRYTGVFTRKSVNKEISYYIRYRHNGEQFQDLLGSVEEGWTASKAAQERKRRILEGYVKVKEKNSQKKIKQSDNLEPTLKKLFLEYLERRRMERGKPLSGEKNMIYTFDKHLTNPLGNKTLKEISYEDMYNVKKCLIESKLAIKTVHNILSMLISVEKYAVQRGVKKGIDLSQFVPRKSEIQNDTEERLEDDEMDRLLSVLENEPLPRANVYYFAILTGMRRGEIATLVWDDVDWRKSELKIRNPKSGKAFEKIPLNEDAIAVLRSQYGIRELRNAEARELDRIFFTLEGGPFVGKFQCLDRWNNLIKERANLPDNFRLLHGMRHQFGTVHAENGTPVFTLKELMRHSDIKTTMKYIKIAESKLKEAAGNTASFMKYKKPTQ